MTAQSSLKRVTWKNSRVLHQFDSREIDALKKQPGKDMMIFGSGSIVSQLTQHVLIDGYQFVVCPVLLGSGRPLMDDVSRNVKLDLLEVQKYESGDVMLRYAHPHSFFVWRWTCRMRVGGLPVVGVLRTSAISGYSSSDAIKYRDHRVS
jgi:dihydrofolate reductase